MYKRQAKYFSNALARAAAVADAISNGVLNIAPSQNAVFDALTGKQTFITANNYQMLYQSGSGVVEGLPGFVIDSAKGGLYETVNVETDNGGGFNVNSQTLNIRPKLDSAGESYSLNSFFINLDVDSSGFKQGSSGNAVRFLDFNANHVGTGDIGEINFLKNYFNIGNGADPLDFNGLSYSYGFGNINSNVNVTGAIQGYGFQPNISAYATVAANVNFTSFYDFATIDCAINGYNSFVSGPSIAIIKTGSGFTGYNLNPTINEFQGNSGFSGYHVQPTIGTLEDGNFSGFSCNPTIGLVKNYADGISISMDNVTLYAGFQSDLTAQDLSFQFIQSGNNNNYTLAYTSGATAGNEVISYNGNNILIQIEDGVSTATQIKAKWDLSQGAALVVATVSGVGSNAQNIFAATNFINGINPGQKRAAFFDGNVEITGSLAFQGALAIGQINAFSSAPIINGSQPGSVHMLISNPTVAANATLTSGDWIGVNTAMLLNVGDNATVGTSFLGVTALGLPAVVTMGSGSTVDLLSAASFVLSLDASSLGGTVEVINLCRALSIPNGVTAVDKQRAYFFDLPFGDPATETWGIYMQPDCENFLKGSLKIGGALNVSDKVTNSSCALEIESTTKALRLSVMTEAQRDALTPLDGMMVINTTAGKAQVYVSAAWVNLH